MAATIHNLYLYHTFMETFKIYKFLSPTSIRELLKFLPRGDNLSLMLTKVKLEVTKQNFVFKTIKTWNDHKKKIFNKIDPSNTGIIIPGIGENLDLSASLGFVKTKLKNLLLSSQKLGDPAE